MKLPSPQHNRSRDGGYGFFVGGWLYPCAGVADGVMRHLDVPFWWRIPLALTPLLPLIAALRVQKQALAKSDELARHIARDAFAFAFYALFGLFVCVDLLRNGGVVPDFVWRAKWLHGAMGVSLLLGFVWSGWRYR